MNVLALETATEACSVALSTHGACVERHVVAGRRHTALVLPMIDEVLAEAGLARTQIDLVAFGCGPGSFTGVRIAASVAQGIAFAAELPVAAVSTLCALAAGAARVSGARRVACATDARREEIYAGAYEFDAEGTLANVVLEDCVLAPDALRLPDGGDWVAAGNGWQAYAERFDAGAVPARSAELPHPHARDVARLGEALHAAGRSVGAAEAQPRYLRRAVD